MNAQQVIFRAKGTIRVGAAFSLLLSLFLALVVRADDAVVPVHLQSLAPEANPWADQGIASDYSFGAYYTRKNVDQKWHQQSRTDQYADVMVRFGNEPGGLVFWRGSSYLPYWNSGTKKFPLQEIIPRTGDGPKGRPDKTNRYARVRIIASTPERSIVHWRYMPNMPAEVGPENLPDQTAMVDEYFVVYPDRTVLRAVLAGQPRYEEWRKSVPGKLFRYRLTEQGVEETPVLDSDKELITKVMGFAGAEDGVVKPTAIVVLPSGLPEPLARFSFDEATGLQTRESMAGAMLPIEGHAAHWRAGVSGSALMMDGYTSQVQMKTDFGGKIERDLTLDAWICIAAYPWNTCPIIQQTGPKESDGFMLAVEADSKPSTWVTVGGKRIRVVGEEGLPRFRWTRLTTVVKGGDDRTVVRLFVDGKLVGEAKGPSGPISLTKDQPLRIAQGVKRKPARPVGRGQYATHYAFEGLVDEVAVYGEALNDEQLNTSAEAFAVTEEDRLRPDMIRRVLPAGEKSWNTFGARFAHLPFHDCWNKMFRLCGHPDIVVSFDKMPCRYVLWHGAGYIPMLVSENGRWYSNEFNENWWKGCCEPMSDKKVVFGRVHILEQSPARVVLKWRYPLSEVGYRISYEDPDSGWGNWSTWYLVIYPDGTMVKRMRIYMDTPRRHEWQESMAIMGPEQRPEMVIDTTPALTLATPDGTIREYSWIGASPKKVDYTDAVLHIVNMKAEYDPFTVQRIKNGNIYSARGGTGYSAFPAWNHWPVAQFLSDGRHAIFPDRTAHSSLTHIFWDDSTPFGKQGQYQEKLLLEGMSNRSAQELLPTAMSWLQPAEAVAQTEGLKVDYNAAERAYVLTRANADAGKLQIELAGSQDSPVVNPVVVVENWGKKRTATVTLNGKPPQSSVDIRQGVVARANGVNALVVWIEQTTTAPLQIGVE
jgi:hypothetical protein